MWLDLTCGAVVVRRAAVREGREASRHSRAEGGAITETSNYSLSVLLRQSWKLGNKLKFETF